MRPNIVFIMSDQQRHDMLSCNGSPHVSTPSLDRLAESGTRFTRAYTACPLCTPARAALFTGMWPSSAGYASNQDNAFRHVEFLGETFAAGGYDVGYTGKWHLCGRHGYYGDGRADGGFPQEFWYDGRNFANDLGPDGFARWKAGKDLEDADCWGSRVADRTIDFISRPREKPFLFIASFDEPHGPSSAPQRYYDMFAGATRERLPSLDDDLADKPFLHRFLAEQYFGERMTVPPGERPNNSPRYYGCNRFLDDQIGRVLDAVDRHSPNDTIVIYTVDHGDHHGAHHLGAKGVTMYEDTVHVSLIVRAPGMAAPGSVCDGLAGHIDLAPTMCDLAGIDAPPQFAGRSLTPLLTDPSASVRDAVFIEYNRFGVGHDNHCGFAPIRCVRDDRYKLVLNLYDLDELYDLREDPHETTNRIADDRLTDVRTRLHDRLLAWMNDRTDPLRGEGWYARRWRADHHIDPRLGEDRIP